MPRLPTRKRTRRRRNSGSVHWREADRYWAAILPRSHGRRATYHDTKAEAEQWLEVEFNRPTDQDRRPDTALGAYLLAWYDRHKARFKPKTRSSYLESIKRLSPLHTHLIGTLKPSHVEQFCLGMYEAGLSANTIQATRSLLANALREAVDDGTLPRVPIGRLRLPKVQREPDAEKAYSASDAKRLLAVADVHPRGLLIELALCLGLRIGELVTLEWRDVDWDAPTLRIDQTAGLKVSTPSDTTKTSRVRVIPLLGRNVAALKRHRERQEVLSRYIFFGRNPRHHLGVATARLSMQGMMREAGVEVRVPHALRHSTASLLASLGVSEASRMLILGHQSAAQTRGYTHSDREQMAEAMMRLERALEG